MLRKLISEVTRSCLTLCDHGLFFSTLINQVSFKKHWCCFALNYLEIFNRGLNSPVTNRPFYLGLKLTEQAK